MMSHKFLSNPTATAFTNVDRFRGSMRNLNVESVVTALRWLRGAPSFPYPTSIHIDLTLRCTGRCLHCKQWTWPQQAEYTAAQIERLMSILENWGVSTVTFGGGNPLASDHIEQALALAYNAHMEIGIISEGIGLTDSLADAICRYAKWIRFSLDGPEAEIHDSIRNRPGLFRRVLEDAAMLRNRGSQLKIGLNCVIQKSNLNRLDLVVSLAQSMKVDVLLLKIPHGDDNQGLFLPSVEEWREVREWMQSMVGRRGASTQTNIVEIEGMVRALPLEDMAMGRPVRTFYTERKIRCYAPFFFMSCDSAGNLYPCDYLQADTRVWTGRYGKMRSRFCCGNVLRDEHRVMENLSQMFSREIHKLPSVGYDECGCCTRFFQFNEALTELDDSLGHKDICEKQIREVVSRTMQGDAEPAFL